MKTLTSTGNRIDAGRPVVNTACRAAEETGAKSAKNALTYAFRAWHNTLRNRFQSNVGIGNEFGADGNAVVSPSIADVARLAGVGKGTVSRVLNERPGVSDRTAAKVRQAMRTLGYRPNIQARRLARNVSDLICFVLSNRDLLHEFHSMVLKGVEGYCSQVGRDVVFALWRYPLDSPASALAPPRIITNRGSVDGIVLAGVNSLECVRAVASLGTPTVSFGNNLVGCTGLAEVDAVWYDESIGTREAVQYLAELGHRHIRFVANLNPPWFARNYRAYCEAMIALGLAPASTSVNDTYDAQEIASRAVEEILAAGEPTTAILAGNDGIAIAVVQALARRGARVPEDVSVIGFDDVPRCVEVDPQLTTVHVPTEQLGVEMSRFLLERISNPDSPPGARIVPTHLVKRDSCAPPADSRRAAR